MRLVYFNAPARAACARLMLSIAKKPFEDVTVQREEWMAMRPTIPGGQLPVLQVNDTTISQSAAINLYVASETGFYPADAWQAVLGTQAIGITEDLSKLFLKYFYEKDPDAKAALLKDTINGEPLKLKVEALQAACCTAAPGNFIAGDQPVWADFAVFCWMSSFVSGFFGVPKDFFDAYPSLAAYKERIASIPEVKAYYEARKEDPNYITFLPKSA